MTKWQERVRSIASGTQRSLHDLRRPTLAGGLFLLAFPTIVTVSPEIQRWHLAIRVFLTLAWCVVALVVVRSTMRRDELIEELASTQQSIDLDARTLALHNVLLALLNPVSAGMPAAFELMLYLYDADTDLLAVLSPRWDSPEPDPRNFATGHGATGTAWAKDSIALVSGTAVSSAEYGLTKAQQRYYDKYQTAASAVVHLPNRRKAGVVTVLSKSRSQYFNNTAGRASLLGLADTLGVVLDRIPEVDDIQLVSVPKGRMNS